MGQLQLTTADAKRMALHEKHKYLASFSEDNFRDLCVRPLFEAMGLRFIRHTCGPAEEGKDCLFEAEDAFGLPVIVAVQTKKGRISTAGGKAQESVITVCNQIELALETSVQIDNPNRTVKPNQVILCASGDITDGARRHIHANVKDPRVSIFDRDFLLPKIDAFIPEFWSGIFGMRFPYLRALRTQLLRATDALFLATNDEPEAIAPITDEAYAPTYAIKITAKPKKERGQQKLVPEVEEIEAASLIGSRDRKIILLGEGGSGKTTAVRRAAYKAIEQSLAENEKSIFPVFFKARSISDCTDLYDQICTETKTVANTDVVPFDVEDLQSGRFVLLVDGLEELQSDDSIKHVLRAIDEVAQKYNSIRVVITSREYAFVERIAELSQYSRYRMVELSLKEASRIIARVSKGEEIQSAQMQEVLRRIQSVHGLSLSPMLVTIFASSADIRTSDIPPNITEVFKKYTEYMLGRWDEKRGFQQQYQAPLKDLMLQHVAFSMHESGVSAVPVEQLRTAFREQLSKRGHTADADTMFDEIVANSGLLKIESDEVSFRHHMFQEFFAGRSIQDVAEIAHYIADEWWQKAILFYFGENSARHSELLSLLPFVKRLDLSKQFSAAVTIGLSSQACYFAPVSERLETLWFVIETLAESGEAFRAEVEKSDKYPLSSFVHESLLGRDAVGTSLVVELVSRVMPEKRRASEDSVDAKREAMQFWTMMGLIEAGRLCEAEEALTRFAPDDHRYLMAIDLGCFFTQHLRVSSKEDRAIARRMRKELAPKVHTFTDAVLAEFRSHLLELRAGKIVALPEPPEDDV